MSAASIDVQIRDHTNTALSALHLMFAPPPLNVRPRIFQPVLPRYLSQIYRNLLIHQQLYYSTALLWSLFGKLRSNCQCLAFLYFLSIFLFLSCTTLHFCNDDPHTACSHKRCHFISKIATLSHRSRVVSVANGLAKYLAFQAF